MSLSILQEAQDRAITLLVGAPGAGKSTFCHQMVLNSIAMERPVIFVTTEQSPSVIMGLLREKGMGEQKPEALSFVDAFTDTVGLTCTQTPDTVCASCADLNSLSIASIRLKERIGQNGILLAFDSLTSPYLFNGVEVTKFIRFFLAKFAAEGNSVVALVDEGCGRSEDLVAMMSISDGVIKIETSGDKQFLNVVKHPKVRQTKIEVHIEPKSPVKATFSFIEPSMMRQFTQSMLAQRKSVMRKETGDFVNLFWPNLAHWSGMLWDPKGFPTMMYDLNKEDCAMTREISAKYAPLRIRFLVKLILSFQALGFIMPQNFSKVKDMKLISKFGLPHIRGPGSEQSGIIEYLDDVSKTDEHYFRVYDNSDCCGLENIGTTIASHIPPLIAGTFKAFEKMERDWNAIETKCIGLGDPYCEFKLVPGEIDGLKSSLEKDISTVEKVHKRLMERLMGFLLDDKPLVKRPKLGSDIHLHVVCHAMGFPHLAGERYRMAQRMGGALSGKELGRRLMETGIEKDEVIKKVVDFMNYCKVGKVTMTGETIRIKENCESLRTKMFTVVYEPSCYFTTGFLNGLFSEISKKHAREVKCIAAGDPYCEWEIG